MSTARDNKYGLNCQGNVCTDPEGGKYTYNADDKTVTFTAPDGTTDTAPVLDRPEGPGEWVNIGEFVPGANGWVDVSED